MMDNFKKDIDIQMSTCIEVFKNQISKIKTGRVSVSLLDGIFVEYYGRKTPIQELSNIIVENSHTLKLSIFDHVVTKMIEKAISLSHLELNPIVRGNDIRIIIPPLTEEKRKAIFKIIRKKAEETRISIRNIRRNANDVLKKNIKDKIINKDLERCMNNEIQILTDCYIKKINDMLLDKEYEIMKV
ncbi:Ribosome-recycling factor [Buchnera aphidicola (Phyllaphis fagi)]|uniref:ribosome recycling factor n=1 Tax=Buchnera aphidicola TaxID=9 RepID=UPI003463AEB0